MNKKLLAIAVGSAMVAAATAATAGDEPTIYGKLHVSIDSMDNDATLAADAQDGIYVSSGGLWVHAVELTYAIPHLFVFRS